MAVTTALLLAACGGGRAGGGDDGRQDPLDNTPSPIASGVVQGPPELGLSAQTLLANIAAPDTATAEVQAAVIAAIIRGEEVARQYSLLQALLTALGGSVQTAVPLSSRQRPLAVLQDLSCTRFLEDCSGTVALTTNITQATGTALPAGGFLAAEFANLQGSLAGDVVSLDGGVLFEFLTGFDPRATSSAGVQLRVTTAGASGAFNGVPFGPLSQAALFEIDQADRLDVTTDGARYMSLDNDNVAVDGAGDFEISGVTLRTAYHGLAGEQGAVDYVYESWLVRDRQPATGAKMRIVAGDASLRVEATLNDDMETTFILTVFSGDVAVDRYQITVTFEPGVPPAPGEVVRLPT